MPTVYADGLVPHHMCTGTLVWPLASTDGQCAAPHMLKIANASSRWTDLTSNFQF